MLAFISPGGFKGVCYGRPLPCFPGAAVLLPALSAQDSFSLSFIHMAACSSSVICLFFVSTTLSCERAFSRPSALQAVFLPLVCAVSLSFSFLLALLRAASLLGHFCSTIFFVLPALTRVELFASLPGHRCVHMGVDLQWHRQSDELQVGIVCQQHECAICCWLWNVVGDCFSFGSTVESQLLVTAPMRCRLLYYRCSDSVTTC